MQPPPLKSNNFVAVPVRLETEFCGELEGARPTRAEHARGARRRAERLDVADRCAFDGKNGSSFPAEIGNVKEIEDFTDQIKSEYLMFDSL